MGRYTHFSLRLLNIVGILPGIVPFQDPKIPRRYECECASSSIDRLIASIERYRERIDKRNLCIATLFCTLLRTDTACNHDTSPPSAPLCLGRSSLSDVIVNSLCFISRLHKVDSPAGCLAPGDDQHINNNVVVFLSLLQARCRVHPSNCAVSLSKPYRGPSQ